MFKFLFQSQVTNIYLSRVFSYLGLCMDDIWHVISCLHVQTLGITSQTLDDGWGQQVLNVRELTLKRSLAKKDSLFGCINGSKTDIGYRVSIRITYQKLYNFRTLKTNWSYFLRIESKICDVSLNSFDFIFLFNYDISIFYIHTISSLRRNGVVGLKLR